MLKGLSFDIVVIAVVPLNTQDRQDSPRHTSHTSTSNLKGLVQGLVLSAQQGLRKATCHEIISSKLDILLSHHKCIQSLEGLVPLTGYSNHNNSWTPVAVTVVSQIVHPWHCYKNTNLVPNLLAWSQPMPGICNGAAGRAWIPDLSVVRHQIKWTLTPQWHLFDTSFFSNFVTSRVLTKCIGCIKCNFSPVYICIDCDQFVLWEELIWDALWRYHCMIYVPT